MKTVLSLSVVGAMLCVNFLLINGSFGQTSGIEMGSLNFPVIYNSTIHIPAVHRPWYKRFTGWFTRSPAPVRNVTYIFPPSAFNQSTDAHCMIAGVDVADVDPYGKGGLVKMVSGGVNHNNITVRFTSKPGEAMLFRILVTGYCLKSYPPNQSYGWAEPLRSNSPYHYDNATNANTTYNGSYNISANYSQPATTTAAPRNKPWWHFW